MSEFLKIQYELYKAGAASICIDKIKFIASIYLSEDEYNNLFGTNE